MRSPRNWPIFKWLRPSSPAPSTGWLAGSTPSRLPTLLRPKPHRVRRPRRRPSLPRPPPLIRPRLPPALPCGPDPRPPRLHHPFRVRTIGCLPRHHLRRSPPNHLRLRPHLRRSAPNHLRPRHHLRRLRPRPPPSEAPSTDFSERISENPVYGRQLSRNRRPRPPTSRRADASPKEPATPSVPEPVFHVAPLLGEHKPATSTDEMSSASQEIPAKSPTPTSPKPAAPFSFDTTLDQLTADEPGKNGQANPPASPSPAPSTSSESHRPRSE